MDLWQIFEVVVVIMDTLYYLKQEYKKIIHFYKKMLTQTRKSLIKLKKYVYHNKVTK